MKVERLNEIKKLVRKQISDAIQDDIDGDETIMKEVWEVLDDDDEYAVAHAEMSRIIEMLGKDG
jgi:hypothetical protein